MGRDRKLSPAMSLTEFDHGYWYALDLKKFAAEIGIPSAGRLRKDELEREIRHFLRSGSARRSPAAARLGPARTEPRDVDRGLGLGRRVVRYTNDAVTKAFLEREARRVDGSFRKRSGAMYRLNRWRERQLRDGVALTYRDVVAELVRLCQSTQAFERIPYDCYVYFISDFMSRQAGATRADAIRAWHDLKKMDCEKTYAAWATRTRATQRSRRV